MTKVIRHHVRVLGVVPCTKGFGFAVLEDGTRLIDWGVARLYSNKDEEFLVRVESLLGRYRTAVVACEAIETTRRGARVKRRLGVLKGSADVMRYSLKAVALRAAMNTMRVSTRYDLANIVAGWFPELRSQLPGKRKPWQSEDPKMSMFVASFVAVHATGVVAELEGTLLRESCDCDSSVTDFAGDCADSHAQEEQKEINVDLAWHPPHD